MVEDRGVVGLDDWWRGGTRDEKWPVNVSVDNKPPSLGISFPKTRWLGQKILAHRSHAATGVVDEDVELAETPQRLGDELRTIVRVGHVGDYREYRVARRFGHDTLQLLALARTSGCHCCFGPGHAQHHRASHPPSAARNDRDLAFERRAWLICFCAFRNRLSLACIYRCRHARCSCCSENRCVE